jgi:hypothetical protein
MNDSRREVLRQQQLPILVYWGYSTSGTFPVSLKVTNECGSTTSSSSFTINLRPHIGYFVFLYWYQFYYQVHHLLLQLRLGHRQPQTVATVNNTGLVTELRQERPLLLLL